MQCVPGTILNAHNRLTDEDKFKNFQETCSRSHSQAKGARIQTSFTSAVFTIPQLSPRLADYFRSKPKQTNKFFLNR